MDKLTLNGFGNTLTLLANSSFWMAVNGLTVIGNTTLVLPFAFVATNDTEPSEEPKLTVMELVPCPDTILAPPVTLHVYKTPERVFTLSLTPCWLVLTMDDPVMVEMAGGKQIPKILAFTAMVMTADVAGLPTIQEVPLPPAVNTAVI